jgi:hypothetical protein
MNPISIIALVTVGTLFGFAWHNQPARAGSGISDEDSTLSKLGPVDWGMVVIWSLVFLSFAAFFLAGCILWIKCHG